MFERVYIIIGCIELLILCILIGKYIYFEKYFERVTSWYYYVTVFILSEIISCFFDKEGEIQILIPFVFFSLLIFLSRKKQRIRGIFLVLPVTGIILSVIITPIFITYLFKNSMDSIINIFYLRIWVYDVLFWISFILYIWKKKTWIRHNKVIRNRILNKWERNLINASGLFLLALSFLLIGVDELQMVSPYSKVFVSFGIVIIIVLDITIISLVVQGNGKSYYQQAASINEYYLNAQLEHFKTYQETQREVRRIYHDMKNHISCLQYLLIDGKREEAIKYISKLNEQVQQIDKEIHTGNDIVDAIVNEKYVNAKKEGITFFIDGKIGKMGVDAVDLCTIFSNAIDNAVEALKNSSVSKKELQIQFTSQNDMQYLMFQNRFDQNQEKSAFVSPKNPLYHGFGLENIKMTIEKYQGHMQYHIETIEEHNLFVLEIMLLMQSTTK